MNKACTQNYKHYKVSLLALVLGRGTENLAAACLRSDNGRSFHLLSRDPRLPPLGRLLEPPPEGTAKASASWPVLAAISRQSPPALVCSHSRLPRLCPTGPPGKCPGTALPCGGGPWSHGAAGCEPPHPGRSGKFHSFIVRALIPACLRLPSPGALGLPWPGACPCWVAGSQKPSSDPRQQEAGPMFSVHPAALLSSARVGFHRLWLLWGRSR